MTVISFVEKYTTLFNGEKQLKRNDTAYIIIMKRRYYEPEIQDRKGVFSSSLLELQQGSTVKETALRG